MPPSAKPGSQVPYRAEIVGQKISLFLAKRWSLASEILEFDEAAGKHRLVVEEAELWVTLGSSKFKFHQRTTGRGGNPSFKPGLERTGEDAVGRRVRVFWPGGCAWCATGRGPRLAVARDGWGLEPWLAVCGGERILCSSHFLRNFKVNPTTTHQILTSPNFCWFDRIQDHCFGLVRTATDSSEWLIAVSTY